MHTRTSTHGWNDRHWYRYINDVYFLQYHQYMVPNTYPLYLNVMKYSLNFTHHLFKTGSRRLTLFNVCAITATTWSLVFYLSESFEIFWLKPFMKVLVPIICWLCDLSGIFFFFCNFKHYLAVYHNFLCTNLVGPHSGSYLLVS